MAKKKPRTRTKGRTDRKVDLTAGEVSALQQVVQMPGWEVALNLLENECIQQETNLVNADNADAKRVLSEHAEAQAMWRLFTRWQKKIQFHINELGAGSEDPGDTEIAKILDATK